jgi:hypothetical protein
VTRHVSLESLVQRDQGGRSYCAESFDFAALRGKPLREVFRSRRNSRWRALAICNGMPRHHIRRIAKSPLRDLHLWYFKETRRIGRLILGSMAGEWFSAGGTRP